MTKLLFKLFVALALVTPAFAQRTPLKVNGNVVSNPNLTNSAEIGFSVSGGDITALVTNELTLTTLTVTTTLNAPSTFNGGTIYVTNLYVTNLTSVTTTNLNNTFISNLFVTEVTVTNNINVKGNNYNSNLFTFNLTVTNQSTLLNNTYVSNLYATNIISPAVGAHLWTTNSGNTIITTNWAGSASGATNVAFNLNNPTTMSAGNLVQVQNNGTNKLTVNSKGVLTSLDSVYTLSAGDGSIILTDESYPSYLFIDGGNADFGTLGIGLYSDPLSDYILKILPQAGLSDTPYVFGTEITHSSGNLAEVKNNSTNKFVVDYTGDVTTGVINGANAGLTLKQVRSLKLQYPRKIDGAGCTYSNTNDYTAALFMIPRFSATGATNANYAEFAFRVPSDLDTSVDLTASLSVQLAGADTSAATYTVGMVSIANSSAGAGTPANYVTLTVAADASGASGDIESVNGTTLTGWRSNMTANQWCLVRLQRDGSDASAVAQDGLELEIFYTSTQ
jgi:hypothetical protein